MTAVATDVAITWTVSRKIAGGFWAFKCPSCTGRAGVKRHGMQTKTCAHCKARWKVYIAPDAKQEAGYTGTARFTSVGSAARDIGRSVTEEVKHQLEVQGVVTQDGGKVDEARIAELLQPHVSDTIRVQLLPVVDEAVAKMQARVVAAAKEARPKVAVLTSPVPIKNGKRKIDLVSRHYAYEETVDCLRASALGTGVPRALLVGPPGTGKSTMARVMADDLGKRYGFLNCTDGLSEVHLLGRIHIVTGEFVPSSLVDCIEKGGLFLLDECDAMDPNTALVINELLSNGVIAVPNRPSKPVATAHKDFMILCSANTYGGGTTTEFAGRNALDAAFLDRFVGLIVDVGYDTDREAKIAEERNIIDLYKALLVCRQNVLDARIRRPVSTRAFIQLGDLKRTNPEKYTDQKLFERMFRGWTQTERDKACYGITQFSAKATV